MATSWTRLRRVSRIDNRGTDALLGKLIACLELQRTVRPSTNLFSQVLTLLERGFSDIAKVLEYDHPSIRLNSIRGQGFRSNMQKMFRNGPFAVCQSLKKAMGRPGTYGLNLTPSLSYTFSQVIKFSTIKKESFIIGGVRGNKHTFDAGVHSYYTALFNRFRDFFFIAKNEVQLFIYLFKFRIFPSIYWSNTRMIQGDGFTPEGNTFPGFIKVTFPNDWYRGVFKGSQFPSFIGLGSIISSCNVLAETACKLTWKLEFFTKSWIVSLGDTVRIKFFRVEYQRRDPIQGLKVIFDYFRGLGRAFDFDFNSSDGFHCMDSFISIQ